MIQATALLIALCVHATAAQFPSILPLGTPAATPLGLPAPARSFPQTPASTVLRPVGIPAAAPLPRGPASSASSNLVVNGGCGNANGAVTTQGVATQAAFDFCGAPVSITLRDHIKSGDVESTAQTLVQSSDTNGLAHGFQVPPGEKILLTAERDNDPDVTAAKGFARATLIDASPAQIRKYATVFLRSILPEDLHDFDKNTQRYVSYGQCSLSLSSSAADQHVIVAQETTCKRALVKPYEIQQKLVAIFSNPATMQFVANADPNLTARRRSLLCVGCRPVQSFNCARCWPAVYCASVAFWCRPGGG